MAEQLLRERDTAVIEFNDAMRQVGRLLVEPGSLDSNPQAEVSQIRRH